MGWDQVVASDGTTRSPVMGPPSGVRQFRCRGRSACRRRRRRDPLEAAWRSGRFACSKYERSCGCGCGVRGLRAISRLAGMDRKTVRRYVEAAEELGLDRASDEEQLTDLVLGHAVERVRPHRTDGRGEARRLLDEHGDQLVKWLNADGLTVVKVHEPLERQGVSVPERTLHRYTLEELGVGRSVRASTVRVNDGAPGDELQVDFGKLGRIPDAETVKQRELWALVFTPVVSRFSFAWLTHRQTLDDVIAGFEAAWAFFGGAFATVIPEYVPRNIFRILWPGALCGLPGSPAWSLTMPAASPVTYRFRGRRAS